MSKSKNNIDDVLKDVDEVFDLLNFLNDEKANIKNLSVKARAIREKMEKKYKDHLDPKK